MSSIIFDHQAVEDAIVQMADAIQGEQIHLIGIQRGGAKVANALQQRLEARGAQVCRGNLDISFYRDDLDTIAPNPEVKPSQLPHDFSGQTIWLIDDVLYTGRTIRAALGEIFDYGRPAAVKLAVLVNRGGHQLPIAPDLVGLNYDAAPGCSIKLVTQGPWYIEQREPAGTKEQP
ncbi:MAG: bifunctional pyr operon transcriptional regulator/uracil phosphoribosyltransferase PyrR [Zetaproteobacteria bacterium CG12_big_fil_rev_8_21_14_0_65_54_13]|nr:MAG: bifunctional pyr operon transcriptional regulator/uracil phosphoribosyltransferase PyrR [Zetaproteobacteria bacterium CG12_big_fil_rev_8_21_14_0_65_54_13]PIX54630.1 MAG: bifunctional pyr operon transcriptional regulator/uracil phosphoribosyltransferase PyrR [Zetaproteobacteria bacterium CG_4_10_14_3_um_filter_54_28]PJA30682.1 MAG: bifunctional pyr operon transcriptional regulator/uracil phosphoribosyltransferase PyrR [Zetaproteobacteria bacterium CG_4_9_14_3_um_filter_54_145]